MTSRSLSRWLIISIMIHAAVAVTMWRTSHPDHHASTQPPSLSITMVSLVQESIVAPSPPDGAKEPEVVREQQIALPDRSPAPSVAVDTEPLPTTFTDSAHTPAQESDRESPTTPPDPSAPDPTDAAQGEPLESDLPPAEPAPLGHIDAIEQYRAVVLAVLERAKRYPLLAQRRGWEGTVEIAFTIGPDGRISKPHVVASSDHRVLDQATLAMIRRVGAMPAPPVPAPLRFSARIQYRLDPFTSLASMKGVSP